MAYTPLFVASSVSAAPLKTTVAPGTSRPVSSSTTVTRALAAAAASSTRTLAEQTMLGLAFTLALMAPSFQPFEAAAALNVPASSTLVIDGSLAVQVKAFGPSRATLFPL